MSLKIVFRLVCLGAIAALSSGCLPGSGGNIVPALKQLPAETQVLLAKSGMTQEAPIFVRIFKEESQLEIWKEKPDGRYYPFKTYPICTWSGELGPKTREGDKQSPEGFYTVTAGQMNPNSQFHLAFNLGYPNAYDRANGRTGSALMVHGDCRSIGCYAMTDALIEEIYALAREAFRGGQTKFHVHAFPFRMTKENMDRHRKSKWYGFWKTLKVGYDDFELTRKPPEVAVCSRQYLVNAEFLGHVAMPDPNQNCPAYRRMPIKPFNPFGGGGSINAKAPSSPETTSSARVASYAPPNQTPIPQEQASGSIAASPAKSKDPDSGSAVVLSSRPVRGDSSKPSNHQPERSEGGDKVANVPAAPDKTETADQTGEAAAKDAEKTPDSANDEIERAYQGPPVTRGIHNVVESGKGDMIAPQR